MFSAYTSGPGPLVWTVRCYSCAMQRILQLTLIAILFLASRGVCRAQTNAYSTSWDLSPIQRAPRIADHHGSFLGIGYIYTKGSGWTFTVGRRGYTLPHSSAVPPSKLLAIPCAVSAYVVILLCWLFTRRYEQHT